MGVPLAIVMLPVALQGVVMVLDEFVYHHRRGLPRWERIGHPLDTLTVLLPFAVIAAVPYRESLVSLYAGLAGFSCLFVTKDEFVHHEVCEAREQWLHSLLFVLHPLAFLSGYWIWKNPEYGMILPVQVGVLLVVLAYQVLYWNFLKRPAA
jgi:hypothetical protein